MSAATIARLAARNLLRSRQRTLITMSAVIAGVALSIVGRGFLDGMDEAIIVGAVDGNVGHVTARPSGYPTRAGQHPLDDLLDVNEATRALVAAEATASTSRVYFAPLVAHGRDALRAVAVGYEESDASVFPRTHWHVEGAMPASDGEVGVSPQLASLLDLKVGDLVILQVRTHKGAMNALEAKVSGLVRTGNVALDMRGLWIPTAFASRLVGSSAPSHLSLRLRDRGEAAAVGARVQAALGGQAEIVTWETETAELLALQATRRAALNLVVFVLLALAAFGIANTILMAAHERVREVGTLRAMGMSEGGVTALFLLEGALLGLVGGVGGVVVGGGACAHWAAHPIDLSKATEAQGATIAISPLIYTSVEPSALVGALCVGVVVAVVASLYPSRVAARLAPADAVRAS